jgi:hypothetical protein
LASAEAVDVRRNFTIDRGPIPKGNGGVTICAPGVKTAALMRMKLNLSYRQFLPVAVLVSACLGIAAVLADDDNEQGGNINGSESTEIEIMMTPTADAPTGSSIKASLQADDENGSVQAKLKLEAQGLPAGTYNVDVTLKSDGSTVPIGTFTVNATPTPTPTPTPTATPTTSPTATPTATPGNDDDGEDDGDNNDDQGDDNGDGGNQGCQFGTGTSLPFPAGFNPFDIATISVSDSNGVVLFTADLTNVSTAQTANFSASVLATGGPGNPGAAGTATLSAAHSGKNGTGSLQLTGHGIRPNMPLTFAINGNAVKSVRSDRRGNVNVLLKAKGKTSTISGSVNLFKVTSVGLHDKNGALVLGASF